MRGSTHLAAGAALSVALCPASSPVELLMLGFAGASGGLLPDIDLLRSDGSKAVPKSAGVGILAVLALLAIDRVFPLGVAEYLLGHEGSYCAAGITWILAVCAFGVSRPHREFTHSTAFGVFASLGMLAVCPALAIAMLLGMLSHVALDLLNKRGLCLLWPCKIRFCLHVCSSSGVVDKVVRSIAALYVCWRVFYLLLPLVAGA